MAQMEDEILSSKKARVLENDCEQLSKDVSSEKQEKRRERPPFDANHSFIRQGGKYHLLVGISGSVACIRLKELIVELHKRCPPNRLVIRIVTTEAAKHFVNENTLGQALYDDDDEWNMWNNRGDPVLHIELRKWADAMLIAPLDANSMAKIANGLCDNLLTCVVRAWDPRKPLFFAPAMNSAMWENSITYQQRKILKDLLRYKEIPPIEKELMCGERGYGAMATVQMIASIVASDVNNRFAVYSDSNALRSMETKGEKRRIVYRAGVTQALTFDEYAAILKRAETNRNLICTNCPLYRPEGGTIIVYDCALYPRRGLSDEQVRKTFRVDGYRWGCSKGVHRLKNGLQKRYTCLYEKDNAHGDKSFMRCEYSLEPCGLVLFHYLGDHEKAALVANTAPHGNAKKSKVPFTRTLPIVLHGIKEKAMQQMYSSSPRQIYKNVQQSNDVRNSHVVPKLLRNSEQVRNVLKMIRREKRSSSETLSLAPTTSVTLYDLDNSHPGRGMKWTGNEAEECEAEASFVDEICDIADAKRVKVEREEEYDSDGSADTIDVINVEVDRKVEQRESFIPRPSFLHESGKYHILIGATGCMATSLLHELITQLRAHCPAHSIEIRIVVTENAVRFIDENVFDQIIYQDEDEWDLWKKQGDPLLHLELCNWADTMLIAPLSANSMAKLANGFCDNLLTSVVRGWDSKKPLYYAPAISPAAWKSPLTQQQRKTLQEVLGFKEISMMGKEQDVSPLSAGLMASADFIASTVADGMHSHLDNCADATTSRIPC